MSTKIKFTDAQLKPKVLDWAKNAVFVIDPSRFNKFMGMPYGDTIPESQITRILNGLTKEKKLIRIRHLGGPAWFGSIKQKDHFLRMMNEPEKTKTTAQPSKSTARTKRRGLFGLW